VGKFRYLTITMFYGIELYSMQQIWIHSLKNIIQDRSWARRARGQSRRGDLLNADFSGDRERPSSPSPLAENKPFLQEEAKPTG